MHLSTVEATVSFIEKYVLENGKREIGIDWFGGEPLLVMELIRKMAQEIQEFAEKNDVTIRSEIVTNGSMIDLETIRFFKEIRIDRVHISMDGMKQEYERRKSYNNNHSFFDHIISSVNMLCENGIQVMIRINVDRNNIDSCSDLIDYLGDAISRNVEVHVAPLYGQGQTYLSGIDVIKVLSELQKKIDLIGFKRTVRESIVSKRCRDAHLRNMVIKPNGDIINCEHLFKDKDAVIGNVFVGVKSTNIWFCDKCANFIVCKMGCKDKDNINCDRC